MTKEEVTMLFQKWVMLRHEECLCENHYKNNPDICPRERSWRNYCEARDAYIEESTLNKPVTTKVDLNDILDLFEIAGNSH